MNDSENLREIIKLDLMSGDLDCAMSADICKAPTASPNRIGPILDWLRQARVALSLPRPGYDNLSDRQLADIGADRPDIVRAVNHDVTRLDLLDLGWQQPRRPMRR